MHEQTTNTDWAFHFLLYIPMIREAVVYFPHYDFDLILVFKWLKRDLNKKKKKKVIYVFCASFCASAFEKHKNQS